jgi:hypothetical protein
VPTKTTNGPADVLDVNQVEDLLDETPVYRPLGTISD